MTKLIDITGKALSGEWGTDDLDGSGIRVLRTTNFTNDGVVDYNDVVTRKIAKKNLDSKYLRHGDIIIEKSGGSDKQPVGRVIYFEGPEQTYLFNNFTGLLRVRDRNTWLPRYVFYSLFSNYLMGGTRAYENRTTGLHNLQTDSYISSFEVRPVSIEKQVEICSNLDKIIHMISLKKKQISKLDELVKSRFVEMFGENVPTVQLGSVCQMINGDRGKNYPSGEDFVPMGVPFVNAGHLQEGRVDFSSMNYITEEKYALLSQGKMRRNDILYCLRGSLGKHGLVDFERGAVASSLVILRCNDQRILPQFLFYAIETPEIEKQLKAANNGSSQPNLSAASVKAYNIKLPSINKQAEFAAFVAEVDKSKLAVKQSLEKLETLKKSLMQQYFG